MQGLCDLGFGRFGGKQVLAWVVFLFAGLLIFWIWLDCFVVGCALRYRFGILSLCVGLIHILRFGLGRCCSRAVLLGFTLWGCLLVFRFY